MPPRIVRLAIFISPLFLAAVVVSLLGHSPAQPGLAIAQAPTSCPSATPEPLWVQPVISPDLDFSQVITVYLGNGEAVTITAASGVFAAAGDFNSYMTPALVTVGLYPGLVHTLTVYGKVKLVQVGECAYGGYTLYTRLDRFGKPLVIRQIAPYNCYLPVALK